jgi:hypothetical protein
MSKRPNDCVYVCVQVVESLAQEDTDIQPQHIALIKHLIEREAEEDNSTSQS